MAIPMRAELVQARNPTKNENFQKCPQSHFVRSRQRSARVQNAELVSKYANGL